MINQEGFAVTTNINGIAIIIYRGDVCMTVYEDKQYQIFHTASVNSVYDKVAQKIYDLTIESWTRLVLKLESILNY